MYLSDTKIRELIDRKGMIYGLTVSSLTGIRGRGRVVPEKWCRSLGPESASSRTYEWENRQRLYADPYLRRSCYTTLDVRP